MWGDDDGPRDTPRDRALGCLAWVLVGLVLYLGVRAVDHASTHPAPATTAQRAALADR